MVLASESIYYSSNVYPNLYFRYSFDDNNCRYRVQRADDSGWHRLNFTEDDWQSCYDGFLAKVRQEHPDFDLAYQYSDDNRSSLGLPLGAVKSFASFFRLTLWWTILHVFYTMIPGYKL